MKKIALVFALALATTSPSFGYETDDFGFPVARNTNRPTTSNYASSRSLLRSRNVRPTRVQYCPPATTSVVRVQTQPAAQTASPGQPVTNAVTAQPTSTNQTSVKATLSATQPPSAQPST